MSEPARDLLVEDQLNVIRKHLHAAISLGLDLFADRTKIHGLFDLVQIAAIRADRTSLTLGSRLV